jgi:acyl dehydratase
MTDSTTLAEKLKNEVGVEWPPVTYEIEKGAIRRFARAVGDPNPQWQNEERPGGITTPPTMMLPISLELILEKMAALTPDARSLHGSTELEHHQPARPGDVISVGGKIASLRERDNSKMGKMVFLNFEITAHNQRQELVAR